MRDEENPIIIIPAGGGFADVMAAVHACAFDQAWDTPWSGETFARLLEGGGVFAFVAARPAAREEGEMSPVGMVLARAAAQEAEILSIGVIPAARGKGVGAALLDAAIEWAKKHGIVELFLEVADVNFAARKLYDGAGFVACARRPGYYASSGGAYDAIVMRRDIAP